MSFILVNGHDLHTSHTCLCNKDLSYLSFEGSPQKLRTKQLMACSPAFQKEALNIL